MTKYVQSPPCGNSSGWSGGSEGVGWGGVGAAEGVPVEAAERPGTGPLTKHRLGPSTGVYVRGG